MSDTFRSLLPFSAFSSERALEQAGTEQILSVDTGMVRQVKDPDTCPAHLLPWLAWEHAVDFWDPAWTERQKRQVIKDAAYVHQHRGTAGAVRRSLAAMGFPTRVIEWWEEVPKRTPYTFRIEVYSEEEIADTLYQQIRLQTDHSKNLRSYLSSIDVIAIVGGTGAVFMGGAATMHIDITLATGEING